MDRKLEEKIIGLALSKGLLSEGDLDMTREEAESRLKRLLDSGLLNEVMVRALAEEAEQAQSSQPAVARVTGGGTVNRDTAKKAGQPETHVRAVGRETDSIYSAISNVDGRKDSSATFKFGRYDLIKLLGEGGMGKVYKAYDPALKRYVALKFIHDRESDSAKRLLLEGRAQAKIDHPNICKVFEAGELEGQIYIAMQFIDGRLLNDLISDMSIEQKVKVMADVADGLHAAHREGLIHRDIKPQNIIVEKTEEGEWKPYVMDFGLVREVSRKGVTVTGELLGTPCYMAPEQARGKTDNLDRRTDIYGLGATLYELLTGQPPFEGDEVMEVLMQVLKDEPLPLRNVDADIPTDIETIVLKCLEKEPAQRYDSALALREDLLRYLAGERIHGQRSSLFYRLKRKVLEHKKASAVVAAAMVLALFSGVSVLNARWQLARRTELIKQYGEQMKEIESIMRFGHMSPLHNINREEAIARARIDQLAASLEGLDEQDSGPVLYAIGRGYASLKEYDRAKDHLLKAWQAGYQQPEVAFFLGQVMGRLYHRRLNEIRQSGDRQLQEIEGRRLEQELLEPALKFMERAQGNITDEYIDAITYAYQREWQKVIDKCNAAKKRTPWLYEADRLAGEAHMELASTARMMGDGESAKNSYDAARAAFERAAQMGASDEDNYASLALYWVQVMKERYEQGQPVQEQFEQLIKVTGDGLKVKPGWGWAYVHRARGYFLLGQYKSGRGDDPLGDFDRAVEQAQAALSMNEAVDQAHSAIASASLTRALYQMGRGEDPRAALDRCINSYGKVLDINPTRLHAYANIGVASLTKAQFLVSRGENPEPALKDAIENARKTLELRQDILSAYNIIAAAFLTRAQYQFWRGQDPNPALDEATEYCRTALSIKNNFSSAFNIIGNIWNIRAQYQSAFGRDPKAAIENSMDNYRKALAANANVAIHHSNLSATYWTKGLYQLSHGEDVGATVDQGIASGRKAIEINPKLALAYTNLGTILCVKAEYQARLGENPALTVSESLDLSRKALELNASDWVTFLNIGLAHLHEATYKQGQGQSIDLDIKQAQEALARAEAINSTHILIFLARARVGLLLSQSLIKRHQPAVNALEYVRTALSRAKELNSRDAEAYRLMAEYYRWQAEEQLIKGERIDVTEGLNMAAKAIDLNADLADAYLTRGALNMLVVRAQQDALARRQYAEAARIALDKALAINRLLEREARPLINEAVKY